MPACVSTTTGSAKPEPDMADAATANFQLGVRYFQNGNYDLARDRLEQSSSWTRNAPSCGRRSARRMKCSKTFGSPRKHTTRRSASRRSDFDVQNAYAVFLCRQKRYDDAEIQLDRSIKAATNDNPEIMMTNAGVCMMQKPDYPKAEEYFRQALERRPSYAEALLQMAVLKHAVDDDLGARAFLQRYRTSNKDSPGVLYLCALSKMNSATSVHARTVRTGCWKSFRARRKRKT